MQRAWTFLALLLLVAAPAAQAAATGARTAITVEDTVRDVAVVGNRFAAAYEDSGSRAMGTASRPVWALWNLDGSLRASRAGCPTAPEGRTLDSCTWDAVAIATSSTGHRVAVGAVQEGSAGSSVASVLYVFDDSGNRLMDVPLNGKRIVDVAMDPAGSYVAVAAQVPQATNPQHGFFAVYNAATGAVQITRDTTDAAATAVDLTSAVFVAGAGGHFRYHVPTDAAYANNGVQGSVVSVDASTHTARWSVAGYDSGFFALYSDFSGTSQPSRVEYQKREAGESTSARAVAIRDDATAFAVGHAGGRLRLYSLDPTTKDPDTQVALTSSKSSLGTIHAMAFSSDGRYLAVRAGDSVRLYSTAGGVLEEMWADTRTGLAPTVAIGPRGETVLAAAGASVLVYDAIHQVAPAMPTASQAPGESKTYAVTYSNTGNRREAVTFAALPPSGLPSVTLAPASLELLPGQSGTVQVTVTVPETWPPGTINVGLRHTLNGGADGAATNTLAVSVPTVRKVTFEADATSKGANLGGPATYELRVVNGGNVAENVTLGTTGLPAGWTASYSTAAVDLAPGQFANVSLSVQPPAGSVDGSRAEFSVARTNGPATPLSLVATVGANFAVRVTAPVGALLQPGVAGLVNLTVRNDGNTRDDIAVRLPALPAGWLGGFLNGQAEYEVTLESGASETVTATLRPPADHNSTVPLQVLFTAHSLGDPTKTSSARVLVTVAQPEPEPTPTQEPDNGIPGPTPVLLLGLLAVLAALRRRKA
jgi:hypothetical protein